MIYICALSSTGVVTGNPKKYYTTAKQPGVLLLFVPGEIYTKGELLIYGIQHSKKEMFGKFVNKCRGGGGGLSNQVNAIMKSFKQSVLVLLKGQ
jgi:hypothetical protein